jgi:hypothetical protein
MAGMKSLAHPEWPYTGTPHEWRGFAVKSDTFTFPDWDKKLKEKFPNGVTPVETPFLKMLRGNK